MHSQVGRWLLAAGATLGSVAVVGVLARHTPHAPWDLSVSRWVQRHRRPWLDRVMVGVSRFGYKPLNWAMLLASTGLAGWRWGWPTGGFVALSSAAGGVSNHLLKRLFQRARPSSDVIEIFVPHEDFSFPSGHVMSYTTYFGFLTFLLGHKGHNAPLSQLLRAGSFSLVLLIGPSRVYVGAHWPSDVLAAYLSGGVILWGVVESYLVAEQRIRAV